jgi:hypothetical protein
MKINIRRHWVSVKDRKLYIIGNGFDLWHNMPTEYENFKEFVREHDSDLSEAIEDYLQPAGDWSDLESVLAEINVESVIDDLEHFMTPYGADDWSDSGHHNFQYEVARIVDRLSKGLRHRFGQWIRQLPIPTPETATMRLRTIDPTARFLTFNYTPTLQQLYGVPDTKVLHIHGRAYLPDGDLVLARIILERLAEYGVPVERVINAGGVPQNNAVLNQVYANVLGKPVLVPDGIPTSLGSGIFAFLAAGTFGSVEEAQEKMCLPHKTYQPELQAVRVYEELYQLYRKVYLAFGQPHGKAVELGDVLPKLIEIRSAVLKG